MVTSTFEYFAPTTVEEAAGLLSRYGDDAKLLAGGHSLVPLMKLSLATPKYVIYLGKIDELSQIREAAGGGLAIGSMVTYRAIESSDLVQERAPLLAQAAAHVADVQVRNLGTIGGSLVHSDPGGDMPGAALALGATLVARTRRGTREISIDRFFVDLLTTSIHANEVLSEIRVDGLPGRTGTSYQKFANKASHYAVAGAAARITLGADGTVESCRIAITGAGAKATRARRTERILTGKAPTASTIRRASDRAAAELEDTLIDDIHASAEYRAHLARVYAERAITEAVERAQG